MKRMDRRKFMLVASVGSTGAILVACGNDPDDVDLHPTMIPVEGAPPTLAPYATPGGGAAPDEGGDEGGDTPAGGGDAVTLEAQDPFNWSTNELEAAPGQVIQITNTGAMEHDFVIDELGIAEELPNGEPVEVTLPDDLTVGDTYTYYCSVPGHRESGMEGTLTIVEASAEAPAEGEGEEAPAEGDGGGDASGPVTLEAQDPFNWSTNELEAVPGQVIQVTNTGVMEHDFVIDELGISEVLPSGEPVEVTVPDDVAVGDTYTYYCSVPGHRESGMEGTLTIIEAAAAAPAEGEEAEAEGEGGGETASGPVTLEAQDPFNWSATELEAAPGQVIQITNTGVMEHDFVIDELGIAEELPSGEPIEVTLPEDLAPGDTYTYYCSVPGHRESGMEGTLTIVEAAPAASSGTGDSEEEAAPAEGDASPAAESGEAVLLVATDPYQWSTHALKAAPGQTIELVNSGLLEHDFVVDDLGLNVPMPIGGTVQATIPEDAPVGDEFEFYCSIAGHRESGMRGTLTIVEATADTSPAAQAEGGATPEAVELPNVSEDALALMEDTSVVTLEATDPYNWSWKAIEAAPGQVIRVLNRGVLEHDFVIDELEIGQTLPFGEPIDIQIPDSVAVGDTYEYYCSIPGHRERGMVGTLTIVEAGAVASPSAATPEATPVENGGGDSAAGGDAVELVTVDLAFEPAEFTIPAGTDVVVTITNDGALEHDFHVDDLGVASDLLGNGESTTVTINAEAGTYEFHCAVPGHREAGMVGTITVE